ncbi:MAG: hypothetical protein JWR85_4220 [Marmoricola sp.]|nr:hypothetical protein [Marmoricola sp.]
MERIVEYIPSSPAMLSGEKVDDGTPQRLVLDLSRLSVGMSAKVPYELAHEPSLRVRISRENAKKNGRKYRIIKHGWPIMAYEIGCTASAEIYPAPKDD